MRIPFLKFIQAELALKKTPEEILNKISSLHVPFSDKITEDHLDTIYKDLKSGQQDYFITPNALPDLYWLKKFNIHKYVAKELKLEIPEGYSGIHGASEILYDRNMYLICSSLSIAKVTDEDIELIINGKYNIHYEVADIKEFLNYYFDMDGWSLGEKKEYVKYITDKEFKRYYELALEGDRDYLLWKLGIAPDKSFTEMLKDMSIDSYYNFKDKIKILPDEAQRWAGVAMRLMDKLNEVEKETNTRKSIFEEIEFTMTNNDLSDAGLTAAINNTDKSLKYKHYKELGNDV